MDVRTGDRYLRDAEGYYTYCGRSDDMLKVGGIWVSPFEVESALAAHPAVLEAAVVGAADGDGLIKPKAVGVLQAGQAAGDALAAELQRFVKGSAGAVQVPAHDRVRRRATEDGDGQGAALQAALRLSRAHEQVGLPPSAVTHDVPASTQAGPSKQHGCPAWPHG